MNRDSTLFLAGHRGLVGSACLRALRRHQFCNILVKSREELDLRNSEAVARFFATHRPDGVIMAAAKVGGIMANQRHPVAFLEENLQIQTNIISQAYRHGVRKLLFLGSSCIYPREAPQPIPEEALLTGPLEPTNEAYAIAKISGIMLCRAYRREFGADFICAMPTNLYGPGDNFDPESSHVLPALIRKFDEAKRAGRDHVTLWGSGNPRREFLHADDLAEACLLLLQSKAAPEIVNVGSGKDLTIRELAQQVQSVVGFQGEVRWDTTRPDGTPRKLLNNGKLRALGWEPRISLEEGVRSLYRWWCEERGVREI